MAEREDDPVNLYSEDGVTVSQGNTLRAGGDMEAPGMISMYGERELIVHPSLAWGFQGRLPGIHPPLLTDL